MSAKDISRFLFQPQKRYSSVRMQQGRVILDSDWNESERIDDEEARRILAETVCAKGTPNEGFLVQGVTETTVTMPPAPGEEFPPTKETYDFALASGSFYLGGLRFEIVPEIAERFLSQTDWLQIDADLESLPARPSVADLTNEDGSFKIRDDLVYLRGWEQCVTAVEDSELREPALGGPDTSVRMRRMRRIEVLPDVPGSCAEAFAKLKEQLAAPREGDGTGEPHPFDEADCELRSKANVTITFGGAGITEDPCKPKVTAGFLGAENQAIRVQLTATNRFIWGYDNASPFYRVQVLEEEGQPVKIAFLTLPRDQVAQPLKGQAVEILPWGAFLPNQEKVAELQGHLATVATSYNPDDADGPNITISAPVPQAWLSWLDDPEHAQYLSERDPDDKKKYFYLRLWTGGSGEAQEPDHAFAPGNPVELKGTGLNVTFSKHGLPGDFWIVAARPYTPDLVVPWDLMEEAPPAGTRFFFAPLALVRWSVVSPPATGGEATVQATVQDCRHKFRPLCEVGGCCTVTVGDGVSSHGDFDSIEVATAYLPSTGGEVCLLPGLHQANVTLDRKRTITIKGCDKKTQVIPREANREGPIFQVIDSQCITLEHMDLVTLGGTAIVLQGSELGALKEIDISHNRILACQQAIQVGRGVEVNIHHNRIRMLDKEKAGVAIFFQAEDSLIERNDIGVVPVDQVPPPEDGTGDETPDPADPCANPELVYGNPSFLVSYLNRVFGVVLSPLVSSAPYKALGGLQIAAASERVKVLENTITGGAGNGITLGGALVFLLPGPEEEGGEPEHVIDAAAGQLEGSVTGPTGPVSGVGLLFTRIDGTGSALPATTNITGGFIIDAEPGGYRVAITSPGLRIETITSVNIVGTAGLRRFHQIAVAEEEREPDDLLAFLYEIQIDRNEIANMGLSGIGIPRVPLPAPDSGSTVGVSPTNQVLARFGNPIVTLGIHRNHIHDCLRNPFDDVLRAEARQRGFGGISLGFCENVRISSNRIERNGINHIDPVCGIFITFGEVVDIHYNLVSDNGPVVPDVVRRDLEGGQRGGIILTVASFGFQEAVVPRDFLDTGRPAGRIHDNVVQQPVGQALRMFAVGPVSVCNNRFSTELSGPDTLERLAGALLILNVGSGQRLPTGITLFNSNETRLGRESASFTAQIIWTVDDLGFDANQSNALTDGIALTDTISIFVNTYLLGATLRATDSRFKEPSGSREAAFKISLLSQSSLLNNTNNNHGDHCIFAFNAAAGRPPNSAGNQVLDDSRCASYHSSISTSVVRFPVVATRI